MSIALQPVWRGVDHRAMRLRHIVPVGVLLITGLGHPTAALAAPTFADFPGGPGATSVAPGPDGAVWFTESTNPGAIGRITQGGTTTSFTPSNTALTKDAKPLSIAAGPGGLWFTENAKDRIGRITTAGSVTEFSSGAASQPVGIAAGPDGNLWFTAVGNGGSIARITPGGIVTRFTAGLTANGNPQDLALGADGNLWFTLPQTRRVGRITPQGTITEFGAGILTGTPLAITPGPDGNLWFSQGGMTPSVGRITPTGAITQFSVGLPITSSPVGIAAGADGNLYVTDDGADAILKVSPAGAIVQYGATLTGGPGLRGITTGPDGRLWFADFTRGRIGRASVAPAVAATSAASVTSTSAVVSSTVRPNAEATTFRFQYGLSTAYGTSTAPTPAGSGGTSQPANATLTGLAPSTTYHVQLVATNTTGMSVGPDRTFTTTAAGAPSATTMPATELFATSATLRATVNPENATTTHHFEWGTTTAYANQTSEADVGDDGADTPVSASLSGLAPNTTYHVRVVATSSGGTTSGADETFMTAAPAPDATTGAATAVTTTSATLAALVDPQNGTTTSRFEWGTTDAYGSSTPALDTVVGSDHVAHPVAEDLTGLIPDTTYHFRVVATNNSGATAGVDRTFTTGAVPAGPVPPAAPAPPLAPGPPPAPAPQPELGRKAVAEVVSGTIRVRTPGTSTAVVLRADAAIPSGSVIDTRGGTIALVSAIDRAGHTQRATFRGAVFVMALSRRDVGVVDLTLTQAPTRCATSAYAARAASVTKSQSPFKLFGKDRNGRYRTHGRNSVATVRGTEWTTEETCSGTRTRVARGSVSVRDLRTGKRTLVRAGHSYLARPKR